MTLTLDTDTKTLIDEITRYLAAVDVFRAAGCEPSWRPEASAAVSAPMPLAGRLLPGSLRFDVGPH